MRIGVVGVGHLGKIHYQQWVTFIDKSKVFLFDQNDAYIEELNIAPVQVCHSFEELISKVDVVDVVTPTHVHFHYVIEALRSNKHVFVEKPICSFMDEAEKIRQCLIERPQLKLQVGHVERFNPAFRAIQSHIKNPKFFEIHRLAPFNPRGTEVSVIMDLMIHDLDILLSLVDSDIDSVEANGVSVISNTPDIANARIKFKNNCVANLTSSRISMKKMRKMRIFENHQYTSIDFLEKTSETYLIENASSQNEGIEFELKDGSQKKLVYIQPHINDQNAIQEELKSFANSIEYDRPTTVGIDAAIKALDLALKIQELIVTTS
jgi:predicted dehydrogenase